MRGRGSPDGYSGPLLGPAGRYAIALLRIRGYDAGQFGRRDRLVESPCPWSLALCDGKGIRFGKMQSNSGVIDQVAPSLGQGASGGIDALLISRVATDQGDAGVVADGSHRRFMVGIDNVHRSMDQRAILAIIRAWRPDLLDQFGVGPIVAATVLCAWSHLGRIHSETAFAILAGVAPIPANSGQVTNRYRLKPLRRPPTQPRPAHHRPVPDPIPRAHS